MKTTLLLLATVALFANVRAQAPMQNGDFESWITDVRSEPVGWTTDNFYSTTGPSGVFVTPVAGTSNFGIRMETVFANGFPYAGFFTNGVFYNGQGGSAYTGSAAPGSLNGMWRYGLQSGDSAAVYLVFKKSGAIIGRDTFYINGNLASFSSFSLPLAPMPMVPDSFVLTAFSGIFGTAGKVGSFVELDELQFGTAAGNYPVPNGGFSWNTTTTVFASGWNTTGNALQTTDRHAGSYAMKLTSKDNGKGLESATLRSKLVTINTAATDTLTGWYKYMPSGTDKASILITLYDLVNTDEQILAGTFPASSNYVFFSIPLTNTIAAGAVDFTINSSNGSPVNGSTFFVDNLAINGRPLAAGVPHATNTDHFQVYPSPAHDVLHIIGSQGSLPLEMSVRDMAGRQVLTGNSRSGSLELQLSSLSPGLYYYELKQADSIIQNRFIKE